MCTRIPNDEGYPTLHIGNVNPMVTIRILEAPKIYERKEGDRFSGYIQIGDTIPYCVVELLSIDKCTKYSDLDGWDKLIGKRSIFPLLKTIYASILDNLREQHIQTDEHNNCLVDKIFRIQYSNRRYMTELIIKYKPISIEFVPYVSNGWNSEKTKVCIQEQMEELMEESE